MLKLQDVIQWKDAIGKKEMLKHLRGESLTWKEAVLAKCSDCTCGYDGGKEDCEIPDCPLYGLMPYRKDKITKPKRQRSEKQIASAERLAVIRSVAREKVGL